MQSQLFTIPTAGIAATHGCRTYRSNCDSIGENRAKVQCSDVRLDCVESHLISTCKSISPIVLVTPKEHGYITTGDEIRCPYPLLREDQVKVRVQDAFSQTSLHNFEWRPWCPFLTKATKQHIQNIDLSDKRHISNSVQIPITDSDQSERLWCTSATRCVLSMQLRFQ